MEIFIDDDRVVLRKYEPCCIFCNEAKDVIYFNEKPICRSCAASIGNEVK